jgi:hypothetical protein
LPTVFGSVKVHASVARRAVAEPVSARLAKALAHIVARGAWQEWFEHGGALTGAASALVVEADIGQRYIRAGAREVAR